LGVLEITLAQVAVVVVVAFIMAGEVCRTQPTAEARACALAGVGVAANIPAILLALTL
jgi:hypothetical protein